MRIRQSQFVGRVSQAHNRILSRLLEMADALVKL